MSQLPTGTVTFLFTDLEGSTRLLQKLGREEYGRTLGDHHRLLREVFEQHGGVEVDTQGDAFFVAFRTAGDAVAAATTAQRALAGHSWPGGVDPRVRIGLHTGEALVDGERYVGVAVHRAQRVCAAGHGGQVLLSNATGEMVEDGLPSGVTLRDLGEQRLKDLDRPVRLFQLNIEGLPSDFPPLRTEAPAPFEGPSGRWGWWQRAGRPARLLMAGGAALVLAGVTAAAVRILGDETQPGAARTTDALAVIDPASGEVTGRIAVGATPSTVAVGEGGVWVLNADDQTISHVDPESREVVSFGSGGTPTDLTVGAGSVWVGNGGAVENVQFAGPVATSIVRIDPETRTRRAEISLPRAGGGVSNITDYHIAVGETAVWAINPDLSISRINPNSNLVVKTIRSFPALAIAASGREVWAVGAADENAVARIDTERNVITRQVPLQATALGTLTIGEGAVWVTAPQDGTLWRVELAEGSRPSAIPVGAGVFDVAVGAGSVWVSNPLRGTVVRVDPSENAVTRTIDVGNTPRGLAVGEGAVWVGVSGTGGALAATATGEQATLPRSFCEELFFGGGGRPDYLIASDLPLQGGARVTTQQMSQAIAYVLRRRGFRAGRFRVGYQSCDDSLARTGLFDVGKCAANAREYARNEKVIGVVGTFNSPCALFEVPILNRAPGGGLAMVSPSASFVGLTREGAGAEPGGLAELYPSGRRNFFRVYPTDDYEGAAGAQLARELGARRIFILHDGDPFFSLPLVESFRFAARGLDLDVIDVRRWNVHARSYRPLAQLVGRTRPDAVFLSGILDNNGGQLVRDLRGVLGPTPKIIGTSGFTPISFLFERAGAAAKGMYVSLLGFVPQSYPPAGRRFAQEFAAIQPGAEIEPSSLYAAQAAEVLLEAIARSDGTRRSVIKELFATRVEQGILGTFRLDRNGDTTLNAVTIVRAQRPGGRSTVMSFEGAAIDRVLTPSVDMVPG
jgi:branched-chain amino acid transport system substrate-binding protein